MNLTIKDFIKEHGFDQNPGRMTEKKQYVEVTSKDAFELDNKLSKVDGILGVSIETVNKARVFYNDKVFKEVDVLNLVAKKDKSIKESSSKMPEKGTPEWHRLQVAKKTVKMNPAMASLMGGMSMEEAEEVLKKYGIEIKEAKISKSVDVHAKESAQETMYTEEEARALVWESRNFFHLYKDLPFNKVRPLFYEWFKENKKK